MKQNGCDQQCGGGGKTPLLSHQVVASRAHPEYEESELQEDLTVRSLAIHVD